MDIRQLRYFVGVVDAGSFTRAAARLHVAQSALSFQIKQMEDSLGAPLLVRDAHGVQPTEPGRTLYHHAEIILAQIETARSDVQSKVCEIAGEVTIGVPTAASDLLVPELLAAARTSFPSVRLKITEGLTGVLDEWTKLGKFNLSLQYKSSSQTDEGIELAEEDYFLVGDRNSLPDTEEIEFNDIRGLPMAMPMPTMNIRKSIDDLVAKSGSSLNVRFEIDSLPAILKLVGEGKAFTVLGGAAIQKDLNQGNISAARIINPVLSRTIVLFTNKHDLQSAKVGAVRTLVRDIVCRLIERGDWPARLIAEPTTALRASR